MKCMRSRRGRRTWGSRRSRICKRIRRISTKGRSRRSRRSRMCRMSRRGENIGRSRRGRWNRNSRRINSS